MPVLRIEKLCLAQFAALSFEAGANQVVMVTGESGTGKSLLLRAIADMIPHQGECYLDEVACMHTHPVQWRKQVGLLPAESQWWSDKVGDHFQIKDHHLLEQLKLSASAYDWEVSRCSTGEKQRLALARLLELQPKALLLDEPTASLDEQNRKVVESVIQHYAQRHQVPVVWVSHDLEQVKRIATRHYALTAAGLQEQAL